MLCLQFPQQTRGEARTPYRQAPRPSTISPVCGCSSRTLVSGSTASGLYALLYHVPSFAVVVPHIHASCGCWCPSQRAREFRKPPLMRAVARTSLIANASPPFQRPRTVGILRFAVFPSKRTHPAPAVKPEQRQCPEAVCDWLLALPFYTASSGLST